MKAPTAALVCVGSELLAGQVNTHQAWLSVRLRRAGFEMLGEESVPDDRAALAAALRRALAKADATIVCGGLGPTFDDLTREAASDALGRPLTFSPRQWARIERLFARYKAPIPEENKRQAEVLRGALVLPNATGSAPGQFVATRTRGRRRSLVLLPGPYSEMAPMFEDHALPRLIRTHARGVKAAGLSVRLHGVPESVADERLDAVRARWPGVPFTILSSGGEVSFHAVLRGSSAPAVSAARARLRREVLDAVGEFAYGEGDDTLESALGAALKARRLRLATAESCTGGLLGGRVTAVPGSSAWYQGGFVCYSNALKTRLLGVPSRLIASRGAVSEEVALAMARGARKAARSDLAVAVTGIAGPGGGTKDKPVGRVHIAVSGPSGRERARRLLLKGTREAVRQRAASAALALAREACRGR